VFFQYIFFAETGERGNIGPLCGSCVKSFTYVASEGRCMPCESHSNMFPLYALGSLAAIAIFVIVLVWLYRRQRSKTDGDVPREGDLSSTVASTVSLLLQIPPLSILRQLSRADLKVLYSTFSIIGSISWSLNMKFPAPFDEFSNFLSIFQLNFMSLVSASLARSVEEAS
jgi:hypothetical protein